MAINTLSLMAATGGLVWLVAPSRSFGALHKSSWQNMLHNLPHNVFDASTPLRKFSLGSRVGGLAWCACPPCWAARACPPSAGAAAGPLASPLFVCWVPQGWAGRLRTGPATSLLLAVQEGHRAGRHRRGHWRRHVPPGLRRSADEAKVRPLWAVPACSLSRMPPAAWHWLPAHGMLSGMRRLCVPALTRCLCCRRQPGWQPSVPVPELGRSAQGMALSLGAFSNLRYQAASGIDRLMFERFAWLWAYLAASTVFRAGSHVVGQPTRLFLQVRAEPSDCPAALALPPLLWRPLWPRPST